MPQSLSSIMQSLNSLLMLSLVHSFSLKDERPLYFFHDMVIASYKMFNRSTGPICTTCQPRERYGENAFAKSSSGCTFYKVGPVGNQIILPECHTKGG